MPQSVKQKLAVAKRHKQIAEMRDKMVPIKEIAEEVGLSESGVQRILQKLGKTGQRGRPCTRV